MRKLQSFLAHACIVFGTVFLVLLVLNKFNSGMQFLSGAAPKWFLLLFCITALLLGIMTVAHNRRIHRLAMAHERERHAAAAHTQSFHEESK